MNAHALKHAFRQLTKAPAFSLLAILSLAIGIGINATLFSAMDAAFLRPLAVRNPDEIVRFERPALSFEGQRRQRARESLS